MNASAEKPTAGAASELERLFALQRAAFARERHPEYRVRRDRLQRLLRIVTDDEAALCAAVTTDFGHRPVQETRLAELYIVASGVRHALRHLRAWMRPQR
ncbi:MAG: coniferyl aldehyde dehydrogenase, partial [Casimicrobiaceae bacterium]